MQNTDNVLRQRRVPNITEALENCDVFDKVYEDTKEEKKTSSGIISVICFAIITILVLADTYDFFFSKAKFNYKFTVDTDMEIEPLLNFDMMLASPCSTVHMISSLRPSDGSDGIKKDSSRFEFTDEENLYWTVLRHAHASIMEKGKRGIEDILYIDSDVENRLEEQADQHQKEGAEEVKKLRTKGSKKKDNFFHDGVVIMLGNGIGMLQIVSQTDVDEGTACRIHGKVKVHKGQQETLKISLMSGFDFDGTGSNVNISHRIEKFHFGPHVPGLVNPLAGVEQITPSGYGVYRYYLQIVPTKIRTSYFSEPKLFYQYSLTFVSRNNTENSDAAAMIFELDFASTLIEVNQETKSYLTFCINICSIIGGIYASTSIINGLVSLVSGSTESLQMPVTNKASDKDYLLSSESSNTLRIPSEFVDSSTTLVF